MLPPPLQQLYLRSIHALQQQTVLQCHMHQQLSIRNLLTLNSLFRYNMIFLLHEFKILASIRAHNHRHLYGLVLFIKILRKSESERLEILIIPTVKLIAFQWFE